MAHSVQVGNVEILSLLDVDDWTLPNFFPSVPTDVWDSYRTLYPDALRDGGSIFTTATAYAVRSAEQTILVDTGLGPGPHERIGGQSGQLLVELRSQGIAPEDVDLVVTTHMHRDHVGWNGIASATGVQATFPRARYLTPKADWEHYSQPDVLERSPYLQATMALYEQGRIELVADEHVVNRDVTLVPTPGHTPGHQAVFVASQGERAAIIGDMAHAPPQVQESDWAPSADLDPELARQTRKRMFDRIEADHTLLCAGHFPHPGFGHLVRLADKRVFQALKT
jgi:glyoxylase-like metal-dependent hydrolase (beta-lactamase superfamily II)